MNATLIFRPNRLGKMISQFGGITISAAVEAADANLEHMAEEIVGEVDRTLELLAEAAAAAARSGPDETAVRETVYRHAHTIASLAGNGGHGDLSVAAFNLCELTDRLIHVGSWNAEAVAVHLAAMRALRAACRPDEADLRAQVLSGLRGMLVKTTAAVSRDDAG